MNWWSWVLLTALGSQALAWKVQVDDAPKNAIDLSTNRQKALKCSVTGLKQAGDAVQLVWKYDSVIPEKAYVHDSSDGQLLIFTKKVTTADSGVYTCVARAYNEEKTFPVKVTFWDPPSFDSVAKEQHPLVHQSARVTCPVRNLNEKSEIFWMRNGALIETNQDIQVVDGGTALVIGNYTTDLDGVFTCNVAFFTNVESAEINVVGYMAPSITDFNMPEKSFEGQSAVFVCKSAGIPTPTIKWFKETNSVHSEPVLDSDKYEIGQGGVLTIKNVSSLDNGCYICQASNDLNITDSRNVTFSVLDKPRIIPFGQVEVERGQPAEVMCRTQNPDDDISWTTMDGSPVRNVRGNSTGVLLEVESVEKPVQFVCVAKNRAGKSKSVVSIHITVAPLVLDKQDRVVRAVLHKGAVNLTCSARGIPVPTITWLKNGEEVLADGTGFVFETSDNFSQLTIRPRSHDDFATYQCRANNSLGTDQSGLVRLVQVVPPSLPTFKCDDHLLPTRAVCQIHYGDAVEEVEKPTLLSARFHLTTQPHLPQVVEEIDVSGKTEFSVEGLNTSSSYLVRFKVSNEAGSTDWSTEAYPIATSAAWSPEPVKNIRAECAENCRISWMAGRDNGKPIYSYLVKLFETSNNHTLERPMFDKETNDTFIEIFNLVAFKEYTVKVWAVNLKGESDPIWYSFKTNGKQQSTLRPCSALHTHSSKLTLYVVLATLIVLVALVAVDFLLYRTKQVSVMRCMFPCCGRPNVKQEGVIQGEQESLLVETGKSPKPAN